MPVNKSKPNLHAYINLIRQSRLDSQTLSEDGEDDGIEYDVFEHITSTPVASPHVDAHDINRNIGTQNDLNSTRSRSHLKSSDLQNSFIKEENGIVNNASPILKERFVCNNK